VTQEGVRTTALPASALTSDGFTLPPSSVTVIVGGAAPADAGVADAGDTTDRPAQVPDASASSADAPRRTDTRPTDASTPQPSASRRVEGGCGCRTGALDSAAGLPWLLLLLGLLARRRR
jgi:MYXO-CTERM domain-containing protein